jgi:hypothetical protein
LLKGTKNQSQGKRKRSWGKKKAAYIFEEKTLQQGYHISQSVNNERAWGGGVANQDYFW